MWVKAYQIAAQRASKGRIILSDSDLDMRKILSAHGGELITNLSAESRRAIANVLLHGTEGLINPKKLARQIRPLIGLTARQAESNLKYRAKVREEYLESGASLSRAERLAERAAIKYASRQHRFRAETIMNTELAFAYNRGAHDGVLRSISRGYMTRCEMVWTTAGVIRTCPRCLEINGKIIGYTDEVGVQLPPLHPRCRCAIIYREAPFNFDIQRFGDVKAELQRAMSENKIKGELIYPPPIMDLRRFIFDAAHTQGDKHPHDVTEQEARKFIDEAYFAIHFKSNNSMNYFGKEGAAYVQLGKKKIRTAFKAQEYNPKFQKMIEVYEDETRENQLPAAEK